VQVNTLSSLPLARCARGTQLAQPLPAEEQLAQLFHLAGKNPAHADAEASSATPAAQVSLTEAYAICERMTRQHSKSFFFSTKFLPAEKRRAVQALYAFCRTSDDIVDLAQHDPAHALADWVHVARASVPPPDHPVLLAWHDTRTRFQLPPQLADELLAGVAMDLTIHRYETFADLWLYCYRVASVVGLLCTGIIGAAPGAEPYAIKLGVALQITNILRDIGEDAQRGRVYLPAEDLERFGLTAHDILAGVSDQRFVTLMQFEIARTRQLYRESWPGIALLPPDSRFAVGAAARIYAGILDKIVANSYDVYTKRAHLTQREKIVLVPHIWQAVRRLEQTNGDRAAH
jgi:phytoene synthase